MRYAIFDFDGTIIDSMSMWRNISNSFLEEHGISPQDELKQLNNATWVEDFTAIANKKLDIQIDINYFQKWTSDFATKQYRDILQLKPTSYDFLEKLKSENVKMCICSSTYKHMMMPALERLDLLKFFDFTCHCTDFGKEKDEPDIFLHCMEKLGAKNPNDVVVFEDALYSASTAKSAGFYVVGIYDKSEPKQQELKSICDQYITDYTQIDFSLLP